MLPPAASWPGYRLRTQRRPGRRSTGCRRSPRASSGERRGRRRRRRQSRRGLPAARRMPDRTRRSPRSARGRPSAGADGAPGRPRAQRLARRQGSRPRLRPCPRPIATCAIAAMCIRSEAPTEPIAGTTGWTPRVAAWRRAWRATAGTRARAAAGDARSSRADHRGPDDLAWAAASPDARRRGPATIAVLVAAAASSTRHALVAHVAEARVQAVDERRRRRRARRRPPGTLPSVRSLRRPRATRRAARDRDDIVDGRRPAARCSTASPATRHDGLIRRARTNGRRQSGASNGGAQ